MSELPRTDDPSLDSERVEEAFASFTERVRELEAVAADLRAELHALRAERSAAPGFDDEEEAWPADAGAPAPPRALPPDWIASIPPPFARHTAAPRLLLEGAFLVAVALLAGLANLSAPWIVLVMAAAWALVALSEWAAAAKRAGWRLDDVPGTVTTGVADDTTGPWDMPVVGATVVEPADQSESRTAIATLPAEPENAEAADEADQTIVPGERPRRGLRLRRRQPVEPAPDPWEA